MRRYVLVDACQSFEVAIATLQASQSEFVAFSCHAESDPATRIHTQLRALDDCAADAFTTGFWLQVPRMPILLPADGMTLIAKLLVHPHWTVPNWLWRRASFLEVVEHWQPLYAESWFYEILLKAASSCQLSALPEVYGSFGVVFPGLSDYQAVLLQTYFPRPEPTTMELLWTALSCHPTTNETVYRHWQRLRSQSENDPSRPTGRETNPNHVLNSAIHSSSEVGDREQKICEQTIMDCVHEPTYERFLRVGQLQPNNLLLKHLCWLVALSLAPDRVDIFRTVSAFWQSYAGSWPILQPDSPQCPVSVLITTFNRPKILTHAITSVLAQTWQDFEVLVVNDGGDPAAAETVAQLNDPRLRYLSIPNSGQAAAFNVGIQQSRGEFLAFLDDDDVFYPDHLQVSLQTMARPEVDLVYGCSRAMEGIYQPDGTFVAVHQQRTIGEPYHRRRALSYCLFGNPGNTVVRRRLLEKAGLFNQDLPWGREWDLWLRCCEFTRPFFSGHASGEYRRSSGNMTNQWYRGLFYEGQLLSLFHQTARGSLILYIAALYAGDRAAQDRWQAVFLRYPCALNGTRLCQFWRQLQLAPQAPTSLVLAKLLRENPLATLKGVQQGMISLKQVFSWGGRKFLQALWEDVPELCDRIFQNNRLF